MDYYTRQDALEALRIAEKVQQYCEDRIRRTEKKG
jgi:HEPN domain-containing protein